MEGDCNDGRDSIEKDHKENDENYREKSIEDYLLRRKSILGVGNR
jgi:hypothetical protein